jgi:hypothetical protein
MSEPKFEDINSTELLSIEDATKFLSENVKNIADRLESISSSSLEEQKRIINEWVKDVKSKDELIEKHNKIVDKEFEEMIEEEEKRGMLDIFLMQEDMSIGQEFDEYMILNKPLEESIARYLENAERIKRFVKVIVDKKIKTRTFGMLKSDIQRFGKELIEKIKREGVEENKKKEMIVEIKEMMEK